jgi:hypothetical protein
MFVLEFIYLLQLHNMVALQFSYVLQLNDVFVSQLYRDDIDGSSSLRPFNQYSLVLCSNDDCRAMLNHDTRSLMKCCETLAFLVRDAAHITPHNFTSCVHAIRTFVEASVDGGTYVCLFQVIVMETIREWHKNTNINTFWKRFRYLVLVLHISFTVRDDWIQERIAVVDVSFETFFFVYSALLIA